MKNCIIFRGGWDGHQPVETSELIAKALRERGFKVDVFDDQKALEEGSLEQKYDLIIPVWTMGVISGRAERAILEAVKRGVGIGGWHGGMCDAFRNNTEYQFMTGGQWVAHPGNTIDYMVNIIDHDDPITKGIEDFKVHSEQYYMHTDPSNKVLATTTFSGGYAAWIDGTVMPVVWTRRYGEGKVFYSSLGHGVEDFLSTPQILEITLRGLAWAAR